MAHGDDPETCEHDWKLSDAVLNATLAENGAPRLYFVCKRCATFRSVQRLGAQRARTERTGDREANSSPNSEPRLDFIIGVDPNCVERT